MNYEWRMKNKELLFVFHYVLRRGLLVIGAVGVHPVPSRTRQLSPPAPMVVCGSLHARVGHCQHSLRFIFPQTTQPDYAVWLFAFYSLLLLHNPHINHFPFSIDKIND